MNKKKFPTTADGPFTVEFFESRDEWLKARKNGLGGSDAGTALGLNKYKTRSELWEEKTGLTEPKDISDKPAVQYGTQAEEHIRELFRLDYPKLDVYHIENALLRSKEHPFLTYSPDGLLRIEEHDLNGILEIKTTTIRSQDQEAQWEERVPNSYYCQVLHGLIVTGFDFVILRALIKREEGKTTLEDYFFEKRLQSTQDDMDYLLKGELEFWEHVKNRTIPPAKMPRI
jgi:putative phage-type endonuclease